MGEEHSEFVYSGIEVACSLRSAREHSLHLPDYSKKCGPRRRVVTRLVEPRLVTPELVPSILSIPRK